MKTYKHPILQFHFLKKKGKKCLPTYPLSQPLGRVWANQNIFNCGLVYCTNAKILIINSNHITNSKFFDKSFFFCVSET